MSYENMTLPELFRKVASELRKAGESVHDLQEKVAAYEERDKLAEVAESLKGTLADPTGAIDTLKNRGHDLETIKAAAALVGNGAPNGGIFKVSEERGGTNSTDDFLQLVLER